MIKARNKEMKQNSRISDEVKEIIGAEILDVDMAQVAGAVVDCTAAHNL